MEHEIFEATERLLETVPQHDLSVAMILGEAGIARGSFYHYFGSKDAVVSRLVNQVVDELIGVMRPWGTRSDGPPGPALHASLTAAAHEWGRHRAVLRACQEGWPMSPELEEIWLSVIARFIQQVSARITWERERDMAPPGPPADELAASLIWSTERLMYVASKKLLPRASSEEDIVDQLVHFFMRSIYGYSGSDLSAG